MNQHRGAVPQTVFLPNIIQSHDLAAFISSLSMIHYHTLSLQQNIQKYHKACVQLQTLAVSNSSVNLELHDSTRLRYMWRAQYDIYVIKQEFSFKITTFLRKLWQSLYSQEAGNSNIQPFQLVFENLQTILSKARRLQSQNTAMTDSTQTEISNQQNNTSHVINFNSLPSATSRHDVISHLTNSSMFAKYYLNQKSFEPPQPSVDSQQAPPASLFPGQEQLPIASFSPVTLDVNAVLFPSSLSKNTTLNRTQQQHHTKTKFAVPKRKSRLPQQQQQQDQSTVPSKTAIIPHQKPLVSPPGLSALAASAYHMILESGAEPAQQSITKFYSALLSFTKAVQNKTLQQFQQQQQQPTQQTVPFAEPFAGNHGDLPLETFQRIAKGFENHPYLSRISSNVIQIALAPTAQLLLFAILHMFVPHVRNSLVSTQNTSFQLSSSLLLPILTHISYLSQRFVLTFAFHAMALSPRSQAMLIYRIPIASLDQYASSNSYIKYMNQHFPKFPAAGLSPSFLSSGHLQIGHSLSTRYHFLTGLSSREVVLCFRSESFDNDRSALYADLMKMVQNWALFAMFSSSLAQVPTTDITDSAKTSLRPDIAFFPLTDFYAQCFESSLQHILTHEIHESSLPQALTSLPQQHLALGRAVVDFETHLQTHVQETVQQQLLASTRPSNPLLRLFEPQLSSMPASPEASSDSTPSENSLPSLPAVPIDNSISKLAALQQDRHAQGKLSTDIQFVHVLAKQLASYSIMAPSISIHTRYMTEHIKYIHQQQNTVALRHNFPNIFRSLQYGLQFRVLTLLSTLYIASKLYTLLPSCDIVLLTKTTKHSPFVLEDSQSETPKRLSSLLLPSALSSTAAVSYTQTILPYVSLFGLFDDSSSVQDITQRISLLKPIFNIPITCIQESSLQQWEQQQPNATELSRFIPLFYLSGYVIVYDCAFKPIPQISLFQNEISATSTTSSSASEQNGVSHFSRSALAQYLFPIESYHAHCVLGFNIIFPATFQFIFPLSYVPHLFLFRDVFHKVGYTPSLNVLQELHHSKSTESSPVSSVGSNLPRFSSLFDCITPVTLIPPIILAEQSPRSRSQAMWSPEELTCSAVLRTIRFFSFSHRSSPDSASPLQHISRTELLYPSILPYSYNIMDLLTAQSFSHTTHTTLSSVHSTPGHMPQLFISLQQTLHRAYSSFIVTYRSILAQFIIDYPITAASHSINGISSIHFDHISYLTRLTALQHQGLGYLVQLFSISSRDNVLQTSFPYNISPSTSLCPIPSLWDWSSSYFCPTSIAFQLPFIVLSFHTLSRVLLDMFAQNAVFLPHTTFTNTVCDASLYMGNSSTFVPPALSLLQQNQFDQLLSHMNITQQIKLVQVQNSTHRFLQFHHATCFSRIDPLRKTTPNKPMFIQPQSNASIRDVITNQPLYPSAPIHSGQYTQVITPPTPRGPVTAIYHVLPLHITESQHIETASYTKRSSEANQFADLLLGQRKASQVSADTSLVTQNNHINNQSITNNAEASPLSSSVLPNHHAMWNSIFDECQQFYSSIPNYYFTTKFHAWIALSKPRFL